MASVRTTFQVTAPPAAVWDALRDYGAVDRLAPGFVTGVRLDGDDRIVTFFTGAEARERLITMDDERHRLVYSVVNGPLGATHHQATVEVAPDGAAGSGSTIVWTSDLLPADLAPVVQQLMDRGAAAMTRALTA